MPVKGRKPKEENRHRVQPRHQFVEVQNIPFTKAPKLPVEGAWPKQTRKWWKAVTALPHCALWDEGDWAFAVDTALIHAAMWGGDLTRAAEVRLRERAMGTTADARRDLRIRYVENLDEDEAKGVAAIEDYRKRLSVSS